MASFPKLHDRKQLLTFLVFYTILFGMLFGFAIEIQENINFCLLLGFSEFSFILRQDVTWLGCWKILAS